MQDLPDPSMFDVDRPCPRQGWPNSIIMGKRSEYFFPDHDGPLSLCTNFGGTAGYEESGVRYDIDDSSYLIFNNGQRYSIDIRSGSPVEGFYVFFREGYVEGVLASLNGSAHDLIESPDSTHSFRLIDAKYPNDALVKPALMQLKSMIERGDSSDEALDEQFSLLAEAILRSQMQIIKQADQLTGLKRTTRIELYKRLMRARDYIESSYTSEIPLSKIAAEAYLSPHHFLRQFKLLFGTTPRQYVIRKRLEQAMEHLANTDLTVTEICHRIGFESIGSFSWMFKRRFGISPDAFRKKIINRS